MSWTTRYILALIPPVVFFLAWKVGAFSFGHFECAGSLKNSNVQCAATSWDLNNWLTLSLFWCPILLAITLPISAFFLIDTGARHIGSKRELCK